ncbi:MAG: DUF1841 family protein [Chromatiales bacterium]|nr:DUF1841 family protein [Gammaproteobacteria bacterium]MBW6475503.1 DUF1841 family protein [Chromatiales bacterium]
MLFGQSRDELRRFYLRSWAKHQQGQPLEPLENIVAQVIAMHPEYQDLLADQEQAIGRDFGPEQGQSNPFLHMGMHLALHEQLSTDRPTGIRAVHSALRLRLGDVHAAEHLMMECLGQALWEAQRSGQMPDEQAYLACLRGL